MPVSDKYSYPKLKQLLFKRRSVASHGELLYDLCK